MPRERSINARPVLKDEPVMVACEGGFMRQPAPADGVHFSTGDDCFFVDYEALRGALTTLEERHAKRPRRRRETIIGVPHHCGRPCSPNGSDLWTCAVCQQTFEVKQG